MCVWVCRWVGGGKLVYDKLPGMRVFFEGGHSPVIGIGGVPLYGWWAWACQNKRRSLTQWQKQSVHACTMQWVGKDGWQAWHVSVHLMGSLLCSTW